MEYHILTLKLKLDPNGTFTSIATVQFCKDLGVSGICIIANLQGKIHEEYYFWFSDLSNCCYLLYGALVRPHMEYCLQACLLYLIRGVGLVVKSQRLVTRMVKVLHSLSYGKDLENLIYALCLSNGSMLTYFWHIRCITKRTVSSNATRNVCSEYAAIDSSAV